MVRGRRQCDRHDELCSGEISFLISRVAHAIGSLPRRPCLGSYVTELRRRTVRYLVICIGLHHTQTRQSDLLAMNANLYGLGIQPSHALPRWHSP